MRLRIENELLVVLSAAIFFKITDAILICPLSLLKCPIRYHNALLLISDGRVVLNNKLRLHEGGVRWEINKLTKLFTTPATPGGMGGEERGQ